MRPFTGKLLALELYRSLIEPHFTFVDVIYHGGTKRGKSKLQTHQNMALRAVLNVNPYYPSLSLHQELEEEWLDIKQQLHCCNLAYKGINDLGPTNNALFSTVTCCRSLRSDADIIFIRRFNRLQMCDNNLPNRCHKYWSKIPETVRQCQSVNSFKVNLKGSNCFLHDYNS